MFWWIVLALVVIGVALAWWSSGGKPGRPGKAGVDYRNEAQAKGLDQRPDQMGGGNISGLGGGGGGP
jgi:hypothetical protein